MSEREYLDAFSLNETYLWERSNLGFKVAILKIIEDNSISNINTPGIAADFQA
jgi:hypothetical protein